MASQKVATGFLNLLRLDQQKPALRRQMTGQMGLVANGRIEHRQVDTLQSCQAALAGHLETPQGVNLVAKELHTHRIEPVGGENIEQSAADGKLTGKFHGRGAVKFVFNEPASQFLHVGCFANANRSRLSRHRGPTGHGLEEGRRAGNNELRGLVGSQAFQDTQAVAKDLVQKNAVAREHFQGREPIGSGFGEKAEIVEEVVGIVGRGADDDERPASLAD